MVTMSIVCASTWNVRCSRPSAVDTSASAIHSEMQPNDQIQVGFITKLSMAGQWTKIESKTNTPNVLMSVYKQLDKLFLFFAPN